MPRIGLGLVSSIALLLLFGIPLLMSAISWSYDYKVPLLIISSIPLAYAAFLLGLLVAALTHKERKK